MLLDAFLVQVALYCSQTHSSVTSWIRTPARNTLVGGHRESRHLSGFAVDVVADRPIAPDVRRATAHQVGLWLLVEGDHDHLEPLDLHEPT